MTPPKSVMFLGSPLGDSVDNAILEKAGALKILESKYPLPPGSGYSAIVASFSGSFYVSLEDCSMFPVSSAAPVR